MQYSRDVIRDISEYEIRHDNNEDKYSNITDY